MMKMKMMMMMIIIIIIIITIIMKPESVDWSLFDPDYGLAGLLLTC